MWIAASTTFEASHGRSLTVEVTFSVSRGGRSSSKESHPPQLGLDNLLK